MFHLHRNILALAGLVASALPATALAQVCGDTYLAQNNPTELIQVDQSTNPFTYPVLGATTAYYNALAYRPADDRLYAIRATTSNLLRINLDGTLTGFGAVAGLPVSTASYHVGAFAPDGFMYVRRGDNNNELYRIDVDALTASTVTLSEPIPGVADIAWFNGAFYGVKNDGTLVSITTAGTVTVVGPTGVSPSVFGAMISASNGVFGANNVGGFYQFNTTTGNATLISGSPASGNNDGARCLNAALELDADLAIAKTDNSAIYLPGGTVVYSIVVTNNGPFGVQNASVSDPLPAGITTASWTCSGSGGGTCGAANGNGAIADTPSLPAGATVTYTYSVSVPPDFSGDLVNTASVTPPAGFNDPEPGNDTSTDTNEQAGQPGVSVEKTGASPDPINLGDTVDYSFTVTNTGDVDLSDISVSDPLPGLSPIACPGDTLTPGSSFVCTASYSVTQTDVDAGFVVNTATVSAQPPGGVPPITDEGTTTIPPSQVAQIEVIKGASGPNPLVLGAAVDYSFQLTNTGNVTLSGITVADPLPGLSAIDCPTDTLAPGAGTTCTASYTVSQTDIDNGTLANTVTVTAQPPGGLPPVSTEDSVSLPTAQNPGIAIDKSGSGPDPLVLGATIDYSFEITNTGDVSLSAIAIDDALPGLSAIDCPATTLAPGAVLSCSASYVVTQTDVDAGQVRNTATVTATPPGGLPPVSAQDTTSVPPTQSPAISVDKSADGPVPLIPGSLIEYRFDITNTGNVSLFGVTVVDPLPGLGAVDCPTTTLLAGAGMICTASYTVTQADADATALDNTATVSGETFSGDVVSDTSTVSMPVEQAPAPTPTPGPPGPPGPGGPGAVGVPVLPPLAAMLLTVLLSGIGWWRLRGQQG